MLPKSFVIDPEFNDIADPEATPSRCLIIPIKHRLHPTYRIQVKDFRSCGVRSTQVREDLGEDTTDDQSAPIGKPLSKLQDSNKQKTSIESLLGLTRRHNATSGLRKYRNKKYLKRAIKSPSSSSSLRRILQVNIRFPVVRSLRTDEDTYATLICELDESGSYPQADADDRNSLSRRYSAIDLEDDNENEDEDWDTSDKGYTVRVKPPDDFFRGSTSTIISLTTSTTTKPANGNNGTVTIEMIDSSDLDPFVEESRRQSSLSKPRFNGEQHPTEANQVVKATIDDSVAETTSISPDPLSSNVILSISPFARGNLSDPLKILTRLDSIPQGKGMDYEDVKNMQIKALSGSADERMRIRARPVPVKPLVSPSNDSDVELGTRSHHLSKGTNTVTLTTQQPLAFNSLKSAQTHYLANFIISSIASLLILTFMFALLVMDTCVDVRHPSSSDI